MKKTLSLSGIIMINLIFTASCYAQDIPKDFIDISTLTPHLEVHMAYATTENFVGKVVTGYEGNRCFLQEKAAHALVEVQKNAEKQGYRLWIYDCYRPQRAVDHFMTWAADLNDMQTKTHYYPRVEKDQLVGEYIAEKSGHSRGSTIDLTLAKQNEQGEWQPIDMGSPFDLFDPISHVDSPLVNAQQQANRKKLEHLMKQAGFEVYSQEWWHFTHTPPMYTDKYFDFIVK